MPMRPDNGERDRLWVYTKEFWAELGFPFYEGLHLEGPFNRSAALNAARAQVTGDWDAALILDNDVLVDRSRVMKGVAYALHMNRMVLPFRVWKGLNHSMTKAIMDNNHKGSWENGVRHVNPTNMSACVVVPRTVWETVGGFDERFIGWGYEDNAFALATSALCGNPLRLSGDLWHLFHTKSKENDVNSPLYLANRDLCSRYIEAANDPDQMRDILSEPGGPLS